jgi:hypothetical protein
MNVVLMRFIRRHLAACGLAVALMQSALQAALPVGLCCAAAQPATAASKAPSHCCTAQSDADGTCPMHHGGSHRMGGATEFECRLVCVSHGEQGLLSLTLGGPLPSVVTSIASRAAVSTPAPSETPASSIAPDRQTPPPRA